MASGRVGGTRSKVSGQIGGEVYRIVKNDDGTYSQIVSVKGETTVNYTTPRLQAQRMVTAMVESLMKQLQTVAKISMQAAANKSKSLNAFSHYNLMRVADDCKTNWYGNQQFVYPRHDRYDLEVRDLGGPYMLSAGTCQFNVFDSLYEEMQPRSYFKDFPRPFDSFYGVKFITQSGIQTVGQFLYTHRMTRLDSFVFCGFHDWTEFIDGDDDPINYNRHEYFIAQVNAAISDDDPLTDEVLSNLFICQGSRDVYFARSKNNDFFALGFRARLDDWAEQYYFWGAFTISYADGKKKISSSNYSSVGGDRSPWFTVSAPTQVFGSWMDDPSSRHYPSPFE